MYWSRRTWSEYGAISESPALQIRFCQQREAPVIDLAAHTAARAAAAQGVQVMCFQELFYGPYFCQVQDTEYYEYTEYIPDGPTTQRFMALAKELGMVMVLPM